MVESGVALLMALLTLAAAGPLQRFPRDTEDYQSMDPYTNFTANEVCFSDNEVFQKGDMVPNPGPCEECRCEPPSIVCNMVKCPVNTNGCRTIQRPNQCCAEYICECEYNGQTFSDGERIEMPEEPCQVCYCKGGDVMCTSITCYTRDDCEPRVVPGQCCPKYENCPIRDVDGTNVDKNGSPTKTSNHSINKEMQPWLLTKSAPQTPSSPSPKHDNAADHTTENGNIIIVSDWLTERRTTAKDVAFREVGGPGVVVFDHTERPNIVTDANDHTVTQLENTNTEGIDGGFLLRNSETAAPVDEVIFTRIDMLRVNQGDSIIVSTASPFNILQNAETTKKSYVNSDETLSSTVPVFKEETATTLLQNPIGALDLEEIEFNTNSSQVISISHSKEINATGHDNVVDSALPILTTSATTENGVNISEELLNIEEKGPGVLTHLKASIKKETDEGMITLLGAKTDITLPDETTISNLYVTLIPDVRAESHMTINTEQDSTGTEEYNYSKNELTTIKPDENLKSFIKANDNTFEKKEPPNHSENINRSEISSVNSLETEDIYSTPEITTAKSLYVLDGDETTSTTVADYQINEINTTANKYIKCSNIQCDNEAISDVIYNVETTTYEETTTPEAETETTYYENLNRKIESETLVIDSIKYSINGSEEEYLVEGDTFITVPPTSITLDDLEVFIVPKQNGDKIDKDVVLGVESRNSDTSDTLIITEPTSTESNTEMNHMILNSTDDGTKFSIEEVVVISDSKPQNILRGLPEELKKEEITTNMPTLMNTVGYSINHRNANTFQDVSDKSKTVSRISPEDLVNESVYSVSDVPPVLDLNSHVPYLQLGGHSMSESSSSVPEFSDFIFLTTLKDEQGRFENQDLINLETSTQRLHNVEVISTFDTTSSSSFAGEKVENHSEVYSEKLSSNITPTSPIPLTPNDLKTLAEILISGKIKSVNPKNDAETTTNQWLVGNLTSESNLASLLDAANVTIGIMVKPYSNDTIYEVDPITHNATKVDKFEKHGLFKSNSIFRSESTARNKTGYLHNKVNDNRDSPKTSYKEHTESIVGETTNGLSSTNHAVSFPMSSSNIEESTKENIALPLNVSEKHSDSNKNIEKTNISHKLEELSKNEKPRPTTTVVNVTSGILRPSIKNDTSQIHVKEQNNNDQLVALNSTYSEHNIEKNKELTRSPIVFSLMEESLIQTTENTLTKDLSQNTETIP